jgi:hypothetical protein
MMRRLFMSAVSALMFRAPAPQLVKVTVWSAGFKVIKTIETDAELAAFAAVWSQKIALPRGTKAPWEYYLDLREVRGRKYSTRRMLYDPHGFAKVLAVPFFGIYIPVYRIESPDELNRLLGIDATFSQS